MAGAGFLSLLDDVTALLDDVARAASKTLGVTGDDLAVRSEQLANLASNRELPVIKKVALGSLLNKAILVPTLVAISTFCPVLITPLMIAGGLYMSYEGIEKILEKRHGHKDKDVKELLAEKTPEALEKEKIRGAVKTDFVMSAEILLLGMAALAAATPAIMALKLAIVGVAMTAVVYGSVAAIIKMDDIGFWLKKKAEGKTGFGAKAQSLLGDGLIKGAPLLMKCLGVVGTAAMLWVGGGMLLHNVPVLASLTHGIHGLLEIGLGAVAGAAAGLGIVAAMKPISPMIEKVTGLFSKKKPVTVTVTLAPKAPEAAPALKKTPDLSAEMANAAGGPTQPPVRKFEKGDYDSAGFLKKMHDAGLH